MPTAKGFAQGEKDGLDYGQKSVQVVSSQIERIAQNMKALPAKVLEDYRDWLIRTSIGIARQIVDREIRTAPEIVADLVRDLIEEAEQHSTLTLYLNHSDLELIEKKAGLAPLADGKQFVMKVDRQLERGGLRVESADPVDRCIGCRNVRESGKGSARRKSFSARRWRKVLNSIEPAMQSAEFDFSAPCEGDYLQPRDGRVFGH